jgi:membrane-associated phospholipid phosphatase
MIEDETLDAPVAEAPPVDVGMPPVDRLGRTVAFLRENRVDLLRGTRWGAIVLWGYFFLRQCLDFGIPFDREGLMLWIATGVAAASIGRRGLVTVVVDWLPFALVLIAYDYLRGASDKLGMPTWWTPQITVDKWLFFGHEPTVWLQEHLKYPNARWWDVLVCLCYVSFFFLPYLTAGALWLRSRADFRRWALRFVTLSFLGFTFFALTPAAPPWAASLCSASDVATHPNNPDCMSYDPASVPSGGVLGKMTTARPGANPYIERISGKGWSELHLSSAKSLLEKGQATVDLVAAVPSLHAGGTMLFAIFMWRRVRKGWRPLLVGYVGFMSFTLVYSAEHYVTDILAGWLAAALVCAFFGWYERGRARAVAADTLDASPESPEPTASRMENLCPPIETTPSST